MPFALNDMPTPPTHQSLESSGQEIYMETHPKFYGIGWGSQQRSKERWNSSTCVLDLSSTHVYYAYRIRGSKNLMAPFNFKVHVQLHSEKPEWLNTLIHFEVNAVFLLLSPNPPHLQFLDAHFRLWASLRSTPEMLHRNQSHSLETNTIPCMVFHSFSIYHYIRWLETLESLKINPNGSISSSISCSNDMYLCQVGKCRPCKSLF